MENNNFILCSVNMEKYIDFEFIKYSDRIYFNNELNYLTYIIIKVENKNIYTSKYLLCINSQYFMSMFKSNIIESDNEKILIEIDNFGYESIIDVLYYIYTKKIYHNNENNEILIEKILDMYKVSDYLQIKELSLKINSYLINNIDLYNFNKIYIFSNKYNLFELKENVIDYICVNCIDIIDTEKFHEIISISEKEEIYDLMKKIVLN